MPLTFANPQLLTPAKQQRLLEVFGWLPSVLTSERVVLEAQTTGQWRTLQPAYIWPHTWASDYGPRGYTIWARLPITEDWVLLHEEFHRYWNMLRGLGRDRAVQWIKWYPSMRRYMSTDYARKDTGQHAPVGFEGFAECAAQVVWEQHSGGKPPPGYGKLTPAIRAMTLKMLEPLP